VRRSLLLAPLLDSEGSVDPQRCSRILQNRGFLRKKSSEDFVWIRYRGEAMDGIDADLTLLIFSSGEALDHAGEDEIPVSVDHPDGFGHADRVLASQKEQKPGDDAVTEIRSEIKTENVASVENPEFREKVTVSLTVCISTPKCCEGSA
jgi:hypothetical protein